MNAAPRPQPLRLARALALILGGSLVLAGCGGGGSPSANNGGGYVPPVDPCAANPTRTPGCPGYVPPYRMPEDNLLRGTGSDVAHAAGYTGAGVKLAIMDSGLATDRETLEGLEFTFQSWATQYGEGSDEPNDIDGHGSFIAQTIVGRETRNFAGGIAPDVDLYIGQICISTGCIFWNGVREFFEQGVRLFNYSMSYGPESAPEARDGADGTLRTVFEPLVRAGGLFVWSMGNQGPGDPSWLGTAPARNPALKDGWLAAAGVQLGADGEVAGLWDNGHGASSNCGEAKDWCVSAPYEIWVQASNEDGGYYGMVYGTSFSAPIVTGVAALTWGAFPWMTNRNVQQTVLTTATHLSDDPVNPTAEYIPGKAYAPNETYGWGLVNAGRAVRGPGQFVGEFDANIGGWHSEFSNVISGTGSLRLRGTTGVLELSADNTYTGGTTIESATLLLSGSVASDVTVGKSCTSVFGCATSSATLAGNGTVHGNVLNLSGNVWSTNYVENRGLTIDGNYTAGRDSMTSVALGHTLTVGGTAKLDGTLRVTPNAEAYTVKSTEKLIGAGSRSGTFRKTDTSGVPLYDVTVRYDGDDVLADVARANVSTAMAGFTGAVKTAAGGIENALANADGWSMTGVTYEANREFLRSAARFLSASSLEEAAASVQSISGELHGTVRAVEAQSSNALDHAVALHQYATGGAEGRALFVQGYGAKGGLAQDGYASTRASGAGMVAGASTDWARGRLGVFAAGARTRNHADGLGGTIDSRDASAGVFATLELGGGYLAGRATWTRAKLEVERELQLGAEVQRVDTTRRDAVARASVEYGKRLGAVTPWVGVTGLQLKQGGFAERGGAGFGLAAGESSHTATLAEAGVRARADFGWAGGATRATGYLGASHVLGGRNTGFAGTLTGSGGAQFRVAGQDLPATLWRAGVTLDTQIDRSWSWYFDLSAQAARGRYRSVEASAGVRYAF